MPTLTYHIHNLSTSSQCLESVLHSSIFLTSLQAKESLAPTNTETVRPSFNCYSSPFLSFGRWPIISYISGSTYAGKTLVELVMRRSLIHMQNPQTASFSRYEMRALLRSLKNPRRLCSQCMKCKASRENLLQSAQHFQFLFTVYIFLVCWNADYIKMKVAVSFFFLANMTAF